MNSPPSSFTKLQEIKRLSIGESTKPLQDDTLLELLHDPHKNGIGFNSLVRLINYLNF